VIQFAEFLVDNGECLRLLLCLLVPVMIGVRHSTHDFMCTMTNPQTVYRPCVAKTS